MNILVFGATGATGKQFVRQALSQQMMVSAVSRDLSRLDIKHPHLRGIQGNVTDVCFVEESVTGQDVVLSALGADSPFRFNQPLVDGMMNIINAMEKFNVKRLIYLSFVGTVAGRKDAGFVIGNITPKILRTEIRGHEMREEMIRESNLDWTIVQAPMLTNGPAQNQYRAGENIKTKSFLVRLSRSDVASFMLTQITDRNYIRKTVRLMPKKDCITYKN